MIDVKHLQIKLDLANGARSEAENPLGTSFDLAEVHLASSPQKLTSSRFFHSWNEDDDAAFAGKLGIWIMPTAQLMFFQVSLGGSANFPTRLHEVTDAEVGDAMFFLIPDGLRGTTDVLLDITLVCMN